MKLHPVGTKLLMNSPKYCLDTHPLIWYFTGQKTLSANAKKILDEIFSGKSTGYMSTIVFLEAFHLSLKKKSFIFPDFLKNLRLSNIIAVPLDKVILSFCYTLSPELDIHDRVIAATAIVNNSILVTKDPNLQKFKKIKTLW